MPPRLLSRTALRRTLPVPLALGILALAHAAFGREPAAPAAPPEPTFSAAITPDQVLARTAYLASDALSGRTGGTEGGRLTEEYIAREFERLGLEFVGKGKDARFTDVVLPFLVPDAGKSRVRVLLEGGREQVFPGAAGALPMSLSGPKPAKGGLAFVGYGLRSEENGIDEYAGVDVRGRVVLVLRRGPNESDPKSPWFVGNGDRRPRRMSPELTFGSKVKRAVDAGAIGVLFVNNRHAQDDDIPLSQGPQTFPIPVMAVPRDAARALLAPAGVDPFVLQAEIDGDLEPRSRTVDGVTVSLEPAFADGTARNVVAVRRGSDPKLAGEAILVSAHMDHVGLGWFGSLAGGGELHRGADDNASGTAALLEIAEALAAGKEMRRTVVFAGWCGEEMGLVGSRHYVESPLWPLADTIACVNLDMVGRYDTERERAPGLGIGGAVTGSTFTEPVERLCAAHELRFTHTWWGWNASDHANFYAKGVPSLFFSTGLHPDYHRPTDTWDKIRAEPQARIAAMAADLIRELANAEARPVFAKRPQRPVLGVRMVDGPDGVRIVRVIPELGAGKAGLAAGDVIRAANGKPVADQAALSELISTTAPGDVVRLTYVRDGKTVTVDVTVSGVDQ